LAANPQQMSEHSCLNCGHNLAGKYCSNCGQKSDTHRITLKHFITHDLVHGVWHIDRGLFFTVREAALRPGKAAMEYIRGKRIKYYNIFYLSLLLLGLNLLLLHYIQPYSIDLKSTGDMVIIKNFLTANTKTILLIFIPVSSFIGFILFRKSKLNILEHAVIGGFLFCGMNVLNILQILLSAFPLPVRRIFDYSIFPLIDIILILLPAWTYYQAIADRFSGLGFAIRMIVFYILTLVFYIVIVLVILMMVNYSLTGKWEMKGSFYI